MENAERIKFPDDPRRCQANNAHGQCDFVHISDSKYCKMHAGPGNTATARKATELYRLGKWQARVNEFTENNHVKSLRNDIGILRMLMEEIVNVCKDAHDIIMYTGKISDLVMKIEKVVSSCHRLEQSTGALLDKTATIQLANVMVEIIGRHIDNPDLLDTISAEIINSILTAEAKPNATK